MRNYSYVSEVQLYSYLYVYRVLSRIYRSGQKPRGLRATSFHGGSGGMTLGNVKKC